MIDGHEECRSEADRLRREIKRLEEKIAEAKRETEELEQELSNARSLFVEDDGQ